MNTSTADNQTPSTGSADSAGAPHRRVVLAAVADVLVVIVFVAIGRRSHDEGGALAGIASTAWPFLVGLGVGWIVTQAWRRPTALATGVGIWIVTVLVGMLVRRFLAGDGTAPAFIVVATIFTGTFLIGWRAIAALLRRHAST